MNLIKLASNVIAHHGTSAKFDSFDISFGKEGKDQEGPGLYFTSSKSDAQGYTYPNGKVISVNLSLNKFLTKSSKINKNHINLMILKSINLNSINEIKNMNMEAFWESQLANFAETPVLAFNNAVQSILDSSLDGLDAFQNVWITFYKSKPVDYVKNMASLGYDGLLLNKSNGVTHYIIYNPNCFKIISNLKISALDNWPKDEHGDLILYRGEYSGNTNGSHFTSDKNWALQFTQSGQEKEVKEFRINPDFVYEELIDELPFASDEKSFDLGLKKAKKSGKAAFVLNEGRNEPKSIYVFKKMALRSYHR